MSIFLKLRDGQPNTISEVNLFKMLNKNYFLLRYKNNQLLKSDAILLIARKARKLKLLLKKIK